MKNREGRKNALRQENRGFWRMPVKFAKKVMSTEISTRTSTGICGRGVDKHVDNVDNPRRMGKKWAANVNHMFIIRQDERGEDA